MIAHDARKCVEASAIEISACVTTVKRVLSPRNYDPFGLKANCDRKGMIKIMGKQFDENANANTDYIANGTLLLIRTQKSNTVYHRKWCSACKAHPTT